MVLAVLMPLPLGPRKRVHSWETPDHVKVISAVVTAKRTGRVLMRYFSGSEVMRRTFCIFSWQRKGRDAPARGLRRSGPPVAHRLAAAAVSKYFQNRPIGFPIPTI
jgi:hypothetical protein